MAEVAVTGLPATTLNYTLKETSVSLISARVTFLAMFIVTGFIGNCMLLVTIAQSRRLRTMPTTVVLLSMSVVNLLDVMFNMPLVLGAATAQRWSYGLTVCRVQAGVMQLTSTCVILHLTVLGVDRIMAVRDPLRFPRRSAYLLVCGLVGLCWLQSTVFAIPILIASVPSQVFPSRYLCYIGNGVTLLYVALAALMCYILPLLVTVLAICVVLCYAVREREQARSAVTTYAPQHPSNLHTQLHISRHLIILFLIWSVTQGPYILMTYIQQFHNTDLVLEVNKQAGVTFPWHLELIFTWMKFSFPLYLPLLTFLIIQDVWRKFKSHLSCKKKNLVKVSIFLPEQKCLLELRV